MATWLIPNVGDVVFPLVLLFLLFLQPGFLFSDGSTGWHLAVGENILNNGFPRTDLISYTFADKAWAAYDWLFDVLIAMAVKANCGSLNLLAVCLSSSIAALMVLLYGRLRKEGTNFASALILVLAGCVVSSWQWTAVPYIATIFGVFFFASWLEDYWRGSIKGKKLLLLTPLLMLAWVNMHPGFFIGIVLIAIYLLSAVILAFLHFTTDQMSEFITKGKVLMCALLLCIAATFLSPYAFELQDHMVGNLASHLTVGGATKLVSPLTRSGAPLVCLQLLYASLIVSLAISKRRLSLPRLVLCIVFTHLSLISVAHAPLFVVVVMPAIAYLLSDVTFGVHRKPKLDDSGFEIDEEEFWLSALARKWRAFNESFDQKEGLCNKHAVSTLTFLVLCSVALDNGQFFGSQVLTSAWSKEDKPTQTLAYLKENLSVNGKLDPERGLNYRNWGGYLHYLLGKRVFIDDRVDFYGDQFCSRYDIVALNQPGWDVELQGHIFEGTKKQGRTVQWILMPKNSSIGRTLRSSPDWGEPVKEDRASELFVRKTDPEFRDPELQNSVLRQD